jgi:hypothetical protein
MVKSPILKLEESLCGEVLPSLKKSQNMSNMNIILSKNLILKTLLFKKWLKTIGLIGMKNNQEDAKD